MKKPKSEKSSGSKGSAGAKSDSKSSEKIAIKGLSKSAVNFNPVAGSLDEPTKYVGQTPAASTLEPNSSNKNPQNQPVIEAVLSITARRKRSNQMRRMSGKLTRLRAAKQNQFASKDRLVYRSQKMARNIVRSRFAGKRGANYSNLSPSDKIAIDTMLKGKSKLIARIAKRLLPVTRKAEFLRLQGVRTGKKPARITRAGGLGYMPKPKLVTSNTEYDGEIIAENLALCLLEGKSDKLDQLMRAGLADRDSINLYRKALADPEYAKKYSVLRDKAFDMLDKLIDTITTDQTIFFRTKDNIQKKYDFNKSNNKKRMNESMDLTEGRRTNAEKARIEKAKKDNKTFLTVASNARSMQARSSDRTGKKPLKELPYPPEQGDKKEVMSSAKSSARKINRQLNPPAPLPPEKRVYRLRTSMSMNMGSQPTNSSVTVIPKRQAQYTTTVPMNNVAAQQNVTLVTGKSRLVPKAPTTTKLPAVIAPTPTPAIKTLRPKSKQGLMSRLITKFGKAANRFVTNKFDLDDKKGKLSDLERDNAYKARLALARGRGKASVTLARGEADSMIAQARGKAAGSVSYARGQGRAERISGAARGRAAVEKGSREADALKLKATIAREFNNAKNSEQKEMLMTIHKQMANLLKKHTNGDIDQAEYERAIGRINNRFRSVKNWPMNMDEAVQLPSSLKNPKEHPSYNTMKAAAERGAVHRENEKNKGNEEHNKKVQLKKLKFTLKNKSETSKAKTAGAVTPLHAHEKKMKELDIKLADLRLRNKSKSKTR